MCVWIALCCPSVFPFTAEISTHGFVSVYQKAASLMRADPTFASLRTDAYLQASRGSCSFSFLFVFVGRQREFIALCGRLAV